MSAARHHAEWLSLVETSGPFLSMPILLQAFPQGLEQRDPTQASELREAYEDWLERGAKHAAVHHAWIHHILTAFLEYPPEFLAEGQAIPPGMEATMSNFGETLRPDFVLKHREAGQKPLLLIVHYPREQDLEKPVSGKLWKASPGTRMMELLHAANVPLGLITNGERWMLVYAIRGETTGFASWYADLWMQEPITLRAFHALLHLRRFLGVAEPETLAGLYAASIKDQQEVTDQLGFQVRQAVEMLVQAFDRNDAESGRTLLADVSEKALYDSALTVMMRLVFLFSAEERGLLLLGDPLYDQHYAVSTLSELLRERADQHGEEILGYRHDAWCRLLATFRAVHSGVEHEAMRLPPYGGTLFDPDRYPFLEGRPAGSQWQTISAKPLPINNRVVLHLLEALQMLRVKVPGGGPTEARRVSFRALDIEQIGHVYEGLLDHTVKRARETTLGLAGSKNSDAEIPISKLEEVSEKGTAALIEFLNKETGRSEKTLKRLIEEPPTLDEHALFIACGQDSLLVKRIKPFAGLLREDSFGKLLVIPEGSVYVTAGSDRRSTGTHYTPRSLTEPIVQHTLEPLVYIGPAEGHPKEQWQLKSPKDILALKVCDMAMGSGAFLVQTCRYLGERLAEAWENAEKAHPGQFISTPEGKLSSGDPSERLIPADPAERVAIARRYVADRCLYGVDINPMAVEMAKLSLWLITLQRDRPFTFLDHALKCGDSLLGVSRLKQIENFTLRKAEGEYAEMTFATANLFRYVEKATANRCDLEDLPSNDYTQIETKNRLHAEAEAAIAKVKALADCLIAFELRGLDGDAYNEQRAVAADHAEVAMRKPLSEFQAYASEQLYGRCPFHWPVEFPEVFAREGFDAFVGNPPFLGGARISGTLGDSYLAYLLTTNPKSIGNADLSSYFLRRFVSLQRRDGVAGIITTNSIAKGETRESGLQYLIDSGISLYHAVKSQSWPGVANVFVSIVHPCNGEWKGEVVLDGKLVGGISSFLDSQNTEFKPLRLPQNLGIVFRGPTVGGEGFILTAEDADQILSQAPNCKDVIKPFLTGQDINQHCEQSSDRFVIDFGALEENDARRYKPCWERLYATVRLQRYGNKIKQREIYWWRFIGRQEKLYEAIDGFEVVLACGEVSKYWGVTWIDANQVFAGKVVVFALPGDAHFTLLNSCFHIEWAEKTSSRLKGDPAYSLAETFETFAFPKPLLAVRCKVNTTVDDFSLVEKMARVGKLCHQHRQALMESRSEGLTKTYNRFHDRNEISEDIARLRELHMEMDQAVAEAYGWNDLDLGHGFHEAKQGQRFTISESARRTVLDRLLALNHQRYDEELKAGLHEKKKKPVAKKSKNVTATAIQRELFPTAQPSVSPAAFAMVLIVHLLSAAPRLRMSELKTVFDFITDPTRMKRSASPGERAAVEAWAAKWRSPCGPEWFLTVLRQLAGTTVRAATDEDDPPMELRVQPQPPDTPELREGIRLALVVLRSSSAPTMQPAERATFTRERRSIFANV